MDNIILITQGSQAIHLVRKLFSLNYKPEQLKVLTILDKKNNCFIEFIKYYNITLEVISSSKELNTKLLDIKLHNKNLVISFSNPYKISKHILELPSKFINFHPGLLPKYKGSLSTVHSMINGETKVGGTWHYMTSKIDKGNILLQKEIDIEKLDTAFSLNHKIFEKGVSLLEDILYLVKINYKGKKQENTGNFYKNKFPNINKLNLKLQKRITYFPPVYNEF